MWNNDSELFSLIKSELFTALVGDVLDKMGYLHQFLGPDVKPLLADMVLVGRAMPVLEADVNGEIIEETKNPMMKKPFGLMFEALDSLKENEVYICSGASMNYALWGGLMTTRAKKLKAVGAVLNGFSRDTHELLQMDFPTFSKGTYAQDQGPRGKVVDYGVPIVFDGVLVKHNDIVFGDRDGVVIIPKEIEREVFVGAIEKARGEKLVKKALEKGMSSVEAFAKFKIM